MLKKCSDNKLSHTWKLKSVDLRHGEFVYEDEGNNWGEPVRRKTISLIADRCRCRPIKLRHETFGHQVFEITEYGGIRRLWMVGSTEERDAWIYAINAAMIGSAGDFEGDDSYVVFNSSPSKASQIPKTPKQPSLAHISKSLSSSKKNLISDSPALAPYAEGLDVFARTRDAIIKAKTVQEYRDILRSATLIPFIVPVFFTKDFGRRPDMRRQSSHILSNQTSQVCLSIFSI